MLKDMDYGVAPPKTPSLGLVILFSRFILLKLFDGLLKMPLRTQRIGLQHVVGIQGIYYIHRYTNPLSAKYTIS